MKKYILILITLVLLTGCKKNSESLSLESKSSLNQSNIQYTIPQDYNIKTIEDIQDAVAKGYVIYTNQDCGTNCFYNNEKILEFYQKSLNNIEGHIIIFIPTTEGDYIVYEYYYANNKYTVFKDTTRDQYGIQDITKKEYSKINLEDLNGIYYLNTLD